jgi:hypothetical protein
VSADVNTTTGTPTVTVATYTSNPGGTPFGFDALGKCVDVQINNASGVSEVMIKVYYTDADVLAAGLNESSPRLYWWNDVAWVTCSDTGVNTTLNYIWARMNATTTPNLNQLVGTPFGGGAPYRITFDQSGVGGDFTGTVVFVDGTDNLKVSDLPKTYLFDNGSVHSFAFRSPLAVNSTKRYAWASTSGGLSVRQADYHFTVNQSGTLRGNYKTQWHVTFGQSGVGSDFTGTVVTVDGTGYRASVLPVSLWFDNGSSHGFAYNSSLVVGAIAKRYVWNTTSGLSTAQSGTIVVSGFGSVTGNYKTQYCLTMLVLPGGAATVTPTSGWYYAGSKLSIKANAAPGYVFQYWLGMSTGSYTGSKNPSSITMNGPIIEVASLAQKKR